MTINLTYNVTVFQSPDALSKAAAEFITMVANKAIAARGRFSIVLSGGQTPVQLYSLLSKPPFLNQVEWKKTFIFWGDERDVPLNDTRNNARQAKSILLDKVGVPLSHIHRISTSLSPAEGALKYEEELKSFFKKEEPRFDLILLGLGENGHTASLFPGTNAIHEKAAGMRAVYIDGEKMFRITMTASLINQARHILFLVNGKNKAEILKTVLTASYQPDKIPAQLIKPLEGELHWFVDQEAASLITGNKFDRFKIHVA